MAMSSQAQDTLQLVTGDLYPNIRAKFDLSHACIRKDTLIENGGVVFISQPFDTICPHNLANRKYYEVYSGLKKFYVLRTDVKVKDLDILEKNLEIMKNSGKADTINRFVEAHMEILEIEKLKLEWAEDDKKLKRLLEIIEEEDAIRAKIESYSKQIGMPMFYWSIFDESEYTDGTSFEFIVYNNTKKAIKYIWVDIQGLDPVNELVLDLGKYTKQVKAVGPIEPGEVGTYNFDYVWFTDIVHYFKVKTVKVQYMDNTIKTSTTSKKLEIPHESYGLYFTN